MVGLAAGLFLTGNALIGASAIAYLAWSIIFGVLVLAPYAGRLAKERFFEALTAPTGEDRAVLAVAVARLSGTAFQLLTEKEPTDAGKAVRAMTDAMMDRFLSRMERVEDGLAGAAVRQGLRGIDAQGEAAEMLVDVLGDRLAMKPATRKKLGGLARLYAMRRKKGGSGSESGGDLVYNWGR